MENLTSKILFLGNRCDLEEFAEFVRKTDIVNKCNAFFAGKNNFEFISKDASKGNALESICKIMNISTSEAIAIGDNENDISMIEKAGVGVAVANAVGALKFMQLHNYKNK